MESCWSYLKTELINHRRFAISEQVKREITEYIETFYNRTAKAGATRPSVARRLIYWALRFATGLISLVR